MKLHFFGIRHHGPGSSKSLQKALEATQPDAILIENPLEMDAMLAYMNNPELKPPVAVLIYNPKDLKQAAYYPYTSYSPEWHAIQYGLGNNVPIISMDLPQSLRFGLAEREENLKNTEDLFSHLSGESNHSQDEQEQEKIIRDPLGYMARLAGYEDSERWWEVTFEQTAKDESIFEAIQELMTVLRTELRIPESVLGRCREAYMRKTLRKAMKSYSNIAIVCGAWHVPALANWKMFKTKDDNNILKGIPRVKTEATWIPWTYERISISSGYGAGVVSPAWYHLLYHEPDAAVIKWMAKVAHLLRKEDLEASSAHVIEAVRLAETLATLRGIALPGIAELYEAVQTIFTSGDAAQLRLIEKQLIVGERMGDVPDTVPMIPLQKDIDKQAKSLRIPKKTEAYWLKANKERRKGGLDLRKEHDRKQSQFLHRLNLLGITWGEEGHETGRELGTMNEYWKIAWKPEFVLDIIEAGMWGNTLEEAAVCLALNSAKHTKNLAELTELLDKVLKANVSKAINFLIGQLRKLAAVTQDIALLMGAIPPLVNILRYGDVRGTDLDTIEPILNELVPRICVSLPNTCSSVDEDAAKVIFKQLLSTQRALALYNNRLLLTVWYDTLQQITQSAQTNALLRGLANRVLWDAQEVNAEGMEQRMYLALSSTQDLLKIAQWIEGFLHGSGLLLIHNHKLWRLLDQWVSQLSAESFQMLLPILRRTFAQFAIPEREKMLSLAKNNQPVSIAKDTTFDEERASLVKPILNLLLT